MVGKHVTLDLYDCQCPEDRLKLESSGKEVAFQVTKHLKLIAMLHHQFEPYAYTLVAMLEESHFSIHTWVEHKFVAIDFFTCGTYPDQIEDIVHAFFKPTTTAKQVIHRGKRLTI